MRKYIKPLLIVILLIILIYVAWTLIKKYDQQNTQESFTNPGCLDVPYLLDINYNNEDSDFNSNKKYKYIIENTQPFSENDMDTIGEVKQSYRFIWILNRGKSRLMRANRNDLTDKKTYLDIFSSDLGIPKMIDNVIAKWESFKKHQSLEFDEVLGGGHDE